MGSLIYFVLLAGCVAVTAILVLRLAGYHEARQECEAYQTMDDVINIPTEAAQPT